MSSSSEADSPPPTPRKQRRNRQPTSTSTVSSDDEHTTKQKRQAFVYTHFEEVLSRINPFGPYQYFACFCILYASIEWAGNYTFMTLLGSIEPNWLCLTSNDTGNGGQWMTIYAPTNKTTCDMIEHNCTQLKADKTSVEFHSLVAAFQLICKDGDKAKLIQVIQAAGSLIGSIVGGHIGDHLGRKVGFLSGQLLIIVTSTMSMATQTWITYSICQFLNGFLYGIIEVTSLTMLMEYTNNKYRLIPNACFQWPIAYMVIALIAYLTKDWQYFFLFLNFITAPITIGFMLFQESPRWLVSKGKLDKACEVLNDIAHQRWNHARIRFTPADLKLIPRETTQKFYSFYHLFSSKRLAKQSLMQILSMFTYSLVSSTYIYTVRGLHDSTITFILLDGVFRLWVPLLVIFLDYKLPKFGRKPLYMCSLAITGICFAANIIMLATGIKFDHIAITILTIIATMINDSAFWMSVVQITTQRYPTVVRCIAFGSLHSIKHIGAIVGLLLVQPLLTTWTVGAFIIPEVFVAVTFVTALFLQPESKGKALMDRMVEGEYGRFENEIPRALMRMAAGHRFDHIAPHPTQPNNSQGNDADAGVHM